MPSTSMMAIFGCDHPPPVDGCTSTSSISLLEATGLINRLGIEQPAHPRRQNSTQNNLCIVAGDYAAGASARTAADRRADRCAPKTSDADASRPAAAARPA